METVLGTVHAATTMLAMGERAMLRDFMASNLAVVALTDEGVREGLLQPWKEAFFAWKTEDGHCYCKFDSFLHIVRGLVSLVDEDTVLAHH